MEILMSTSESLNKVSNAFAELVSLLTGNTIKFEETKSGESWGIGFEKVAKMLESASEAIKNRSLKTVMGLEPGKIYCLQVDANCNVDFVFSVVEHLKAQYNIDVLIIDTSSEFVSIPEGYEIVKK